MSFSSLVRRAQKAAQTHRDLTAEITEAFVARYGVTHSDAGCDFLIDAFDYGEHPTLSVRKIDELMAATGNPMLSKAPTEAGE